MKFRLWPRREPPEPVVEDEAPAPQAEPEPEREPEPEPEPRPEPEPEPLPVSVAPPPTPPTPPLVERPQPEPEPPAPAKVSLTIDEAKGAIREAGGDVIQVGFLASAYRRHLQEDPTSSETAASRKRLRELMSKRLKDRGLLASDGTFELREEPRAASE
jgi:outer membrane biosynthesis protein TonB